MVIILEVVLLIDIFVILINFLQLLKVVLDYLL